MEHLYTRWQLKNLEKALSTRRILLISGPRQCGKTTLAKELKLHNTIYRTLDDGTLKQFAENDPLGFIKYPGKTLIIDEIQRVPSLLPAIKMIVDQDNRPGQFILTGSANIQSLPTVQESLAGRIRKLRLRPLSQGEIANTAPNFLSAAFSQNFIPNGQYNRKDILTMAFRGGFPEAVRLSEKEKSRWHRDYLTTILEHDLHDIMRIHRQSVMNDLASVLAAWSSKFMDISSICTSLSISRPTLESYINALEIIYIIEKVPPWSHTDYGRVGKQSKLFMADSGLMASTLRWRLDNVELNADRSGKLIETFVFNELSAQIDASDGEYKLYHYRDREQREIDFLIEREDDLALVGIEVKAGSAISPNDFKHLKWFQNRLAKDKLFVGIVLYTGDTVGSLDKNLWAVPFSVLW